jgi:multiple sugar transport system permease protein
VITLGPIWRRVGPYVNLLIAVAIVLVLLSPLYWAAVTSLKTQNQAYASPATLLPPTLNFSAYSHVVSAQGHALLSSLLIGFGTALFSLIIATPAAYALAHFRFRVTGLIVLCLLAAQMVPTIVIGTSLFKTFTHLHLLNSYLGLILADSTYTVPFAILVLRAFLLGIPHELLEAAAIDGAGEVRRFLSVIVPLSRPGLLSVTLFSFLFAWGDFLFALTLTTTNAIVPMTISIYSYVGVSIENWPAVMAASLFAALPAAVFLVVVQRSVKGGLVSTGLKG